MKSSMNENEQNDIILHCVLVFRCRVYVSIQNSVFLPNPTWIKTFLLFSNSKLWDGFFFYLKIIVKLYIRFQNIITASSYNFTQKKSWNCKRFTFDWYGKLKNRYGYDPYLSNLSPINFDVQESVQQNFNGF